MSVSRFRHTNCVASTDEHSFLNVNPSNALWDGSNVISCNEKFVAVPWASNGSIAVFLNGKNGRLPTNPAVFKGQGGAIIESCFDRFNPERLASSSEAGDICLWKVPEEGLQEDCDSPLTRLEGHSRKCGTLEFHPSAEGVLASAGVDKIVNIWDVEKSVAKIQFKQHEDYVTGFSWNLDGSLFCTMSRNKKLNIVDVRNDKLVDSVKAHDGTRSQRCVWAKRLNKIFSFGWDSAQRREITEWDPRNLKESLNTIFIDQSSSAFMPYFDDDTNLLMLASRGEGTLRCYEYLDNSLLQSCNYMSSEPVKGFCSFPKTTLDVKKCEINRVYLLNQNKLFSVHMFLPRKNAEDEFQLDVFPPTFANKPAIQAEKYFSGNNANPLESDLRPLFEGRIVTESQKTSTVTKPAVNTTSTPSTKDFKPSPVKSSPSKDVSSNSKTIHSAHVDPLNMEDGTFNKQNKLKELKSQLLAQKAELERLRAEARKKEEEISKTLEEIENAL